MAVFDSNNDSEMVYGSNNDMDSESDWEINEIDGEAAGQSDGDPESDIPIDIL